MFHEAATHTLLEFCTRLPVICTTCMLCAEQVNIAILYWIL